MNLLFLSQAVIARRLPQLWFEALHPNPMVSEESQRAVSEKIEAFSESMVAGQMAAMNAPFAMAAAIMQGRSPFFAAMAIPGKVARAATAPIEKRLKSNVKRLSGPIGKKSRSTKR